MSDSSSKLDQLSTSQADKEATVNAVQDAVSQGAIFGRRASTTTGLTWGFYGGRFTTNSGANIDIANGTLALTASAVNYVEADAAGTVSKNTSAFSDTGIPLHTIYTSSTAVNSYTDNRDGTQGNGRVATKRTTQTMWVPAGAMSPRLTNGCGWGNVETSSYNVLMSTLNFDPSSKEYAQFSARMPAGWDVGSFTAAFDWSHASTTNSFGVRWGIQALAVSDGDSLAVDFGTASEVSDVGGATNTHYATAVSSGFVPSNSPARGDLVIFQVYRDPTHSDDSLAVDARLHGVLINYKATSLNDA